MYIVLLKLSWLVIQKWTVPLFLHRQKKRFQTGLQKAARSPAADPLPPPHQTPFYSFFSVQLTTVEIVM